MAVAALLSSDAASRRCCYRCYRYCYCYCAPVFCRMHAGLGCLPSSPPVPGDTSCPRPSKKMKENSSGKTEMFESKTVNFHTVLEGKKQQFLKISVQPQSARRLQAILFCGRHGFHPPTFHLSSSASRVTLWDFRMAVGMSVF